jgi:CMP-N-acetylneuraminic acid synthetase
MGRRADDLAVFVNARLSSRRCPNKMLRPFASTTLIDVCLEKLQTLAWPKTYFGAHDQVLLDRARGIPGIVVHHRSAQSAAANSDAAKIFEILHVIDAPWVLWVNPCAPLISVDTIRSAIATFLAGDAVSMTAVCARHGWFYGEDGRLLNETRGNVDTALSAPILQVTHAFHIYPRMRMAETGRPWPNEPQDPELFRMAEAEAHDIDTEHEFETVEYLYRRRQYEQDPHR